MSRRQVKPGTALVNGCLELLAAEHVPAIRMNTGTFVFTDDKGKRRRFAAGEPGMADIMAFIPPENIRVVPPRPTVVPTSDMVRDQLPDIGTHGFTIERAMKREGRPTEALWVECKFGSGRQSPAQKEFQQRVTAWGHTYLLVTDSDQLAAWLREWKVKVNT
jgi:hypothetical protein